MGSMEIHEAKLKNKTIANVQRDCAYSKLLSRVMMACLSSLSFFIFAGTVLDMYGPNGRDLF